MYTYIYIYTHIIYIYLIYADSYRTKPFVEPLAKYYADTFAEPFVKWRRSPHVIDGHRLPAEGFAEHSTEGNAKCFTARLNTSCVFVLFIICVPLV